MFTLAILRCCFAVILYKCDASELNFADFFPFWAFVL